MIRSLWLRYLSKKVFQITHDSANTSSSEGNQLVLSLIKIIDDAKVAAYSTKTLISCSVRSKTSICRPYDKKFKLIGYSLSI